MKHLTKAPLARLASRLAALFLAIAVPGILYLSFVAPLWAVYAERADEIERSRILLGRYGATTVSTAAPLVQPSVRAFCVGKTDALVLAGLQGDLQSIAAAQGVALRSVQSLPNVTLGSLVLTGLGIDMAGEFARVQAMIYAVETTSPVLILRRAEIRRVASPSDAAASIPVEAQFQVYCAVDRKD